MKVNDPAAMREILETARALAVVGLSSKPTRPSFGVSQYLQAVGYRIIPVNPNETRVLGEPSYQSLDDVAESIDGVVIFRRSEKVAPVVDQAIGRGVRFIWMQEGICDDVAARRALNAGLMVVMNRCMLKEHRKLSCQTSETARP